jgi:phosphate-selective porin O/P
MTRMKMICAISLLVATAAFAQTKPDDTPKFNIGAIIFADYTYQESPRITDADKNSVNFSSFNVSRAYINFTGSLNHLISFRITPDIVRETGSSSLNGSLTYRLKYAYGQLALDDWMTKGSWVRFGIHQTPYIDYTEGIYRYRFQGPVFVDREGFMSASDAGISGHWNAPGDYGDVHAGFYNGENYNHPEQNNQKAFEIRGTVRPLPSGGVWKGLRLTAFADQDRPVADGRRERHIEQISFEHPYVNAAIEILQARDKALSTSATAEAKGWSAWVTPRLGKTGWEMLLRRDALKPDSNQAQKRTRNIAGIAYWLPHMTRVSTAIMLDYDSLKRTGVTPSVPDTTNYAVHMMINF